jgi:hypothetical protein
VISQCEWGVAFEWFDLALLGSVAKGSLDDVAEALEQDLFTVRIRTTEVAGGLKSPNLMAHELGGWNMPGPLDDRAS